LGIVPQALVKKPKNLQNVVKTLLEKAGDQKKVLLRVFKFNGKMKKGLFIFYVIFGTALILKFFHIHYNAIGMLVGLFGILGLGLVDLVKPRTSENRFSHLTVGFWLAYLFTQVKFLSFGLPVLAVSLLFTLLFIVAVIRSKNFTLMVPVVSAAFFAVSIAGMPTDDRYYLFNVKGNYEIESDYYTLDKYSWFLYQNQKFEEALQVSIEAYGIATREGDLDFFEVIDRHQIAIKKRDWPHYNPHHD